LTVNEHVHERITGDALIDHEQVNIGGRVLVEHADGLEVDAKTVPLVLGLDLCEQVPPHGDPTDPGVDLLLQRLRDHEGHAGLARSGGRLDHHGPHGGSEIALPVAVGAREHVERLADDAGLVWAGLHMGAGHGLPGTKRRDEVRSLTVAVDAGRYMPE
jgi:hypothetical protein